MEKKTEKKLAKKRSSTSATRGRKKKAQKGILGVKKSRMLFTFGGELWSDDGDGDGEGEEEEERDEDPDYSHRGAASRHKPAKSGLRQDPQETRDQLPSTSTSTCSSAKANGCIPREKQSTRSKTVAFESLPELPDVPRERITLKIPLNLKKEVKKRGRKKKGADASPAGAGGRRGRKGKKKEPYYDDDTKALKEEAVLSEMYPMQGRAGGGGGGGKKLKVLFEENRGKVNVLLPNEILVKIFKTVVDTDPSRAVHQVIALSQVCESWRALVLSTPYIWEHLDLSDFNYASVESDLMELLETEALASVKHVNLSGWNSVNEIIVTKLVKRFGDNLKGISLRDCHNITTNCLQILSDNCPSLESLDLSRTSYTHFNPAPSKQKKKVKPAERSNPLQPTSFKTFLTNCGSRLTGLNLAENKLQSFAVLSGAIIENCCSLRLLDLSNIESPSSYLSVEKLQAGCPLLKVLRLANVGLKASGAYSGGFPHLEELSIPVISGETTSTVGHSDNVLGSLTQKAENLKLLDIRGSCNISVSCLIKIPAWNLQHLAIANCSRLHSPDLELALGKWKHSLLDVDLSWNGSDPSVKSSLEALASEEASELKSIQLRGSAVCFPTVKKLLISCKKLESIDLQSCRGLPRGIKRNFEGSEFKKFREDAMHGHYDYE